jgi:UDP-N-acetylmuramyl pentapeptide phosphotransferase/UDP-N-acetylglucosamine-1-phosphate transferase
VAATFLLSFGFCVVVISFLLRTKLAWRIATDVPNSRSLHSVPVPRIGGWGVVPAALIAGAAFAGPDPLVIGLTVVLFAVSYVDDRVGLPILLRLSTHAAAAACWLVSGPVHLPIAVGLMAAFAMLWITNLFNFMDGADGLAAGMALFAFGAYAYVAALCGMAPLALWSVALAGAAAGFLLFNFSPARVFLGDGGSITVGFLAGAFGIWGWAAGAWPVWFPFLVSAPFFLDATATILRRMISGERFWRAHREHYYQRLIRSGWTHRRTALCEYALMAASAGLAVAMLGWSARAQYLGLGAAAVVYVALAYAVDRRWIAFQGANAPAAPLTPIPRKSAAMHKTGGSRITTHARPAASPAPSPAVHKPSGSRITTQRDGFMGEAIKAAHRTRVNADERSYEHESERR